MSLYTIGQRFCFLANYVVNPRSNLDIGLLQSFGQNLSVCGYVCRQEEVWLSYVHTLSDGTYFCLSCLCIFSMPTFQSGTSYT